MLIDARTILKDTTIKTDVCIIGAGAAGITLAKEFAGASFEVCLVESGGLLFDSKTQSLYEGKNVGRSYFPLSISRLRYFGGTTNHWAGWCHPLEEIDFEERAWIPNSGWPFRKTHLDPFYRRAQVVCQLGPYTYKVQDWELENRPPLQFLGDRVNTTIFQLSPPTRFGAVYRNEIVSADNISTYLHANVTEIEVSENAQFVTRLHLSCLSGNDFWLKSKIYILAAGGIENPRLLLVSSKKQKTGLGNENDLVGRFFMDQPHLESGVLLFSDVSYQPNLYLQPEKKRPSTPSIVGALTLSAEVQRRERMANFSAVMEVSTWSRLSQGFGSLRYLSRNLRRRKEPDELFKHLWNVITDFDDIATAFYRKMVKEDTLDHLFILYNRTEPVPNPESRVFLIDERDQLGVNRISLDWKLSEIDKYSIKKAHKIIGSELGRAGLGRLKITFDEDLHLLEGGWHHIGTTRMNRSPKKGVVDEHCKVHGIANLYVAGSSVFPTAGYANPTLTIVALSIRLADHIKIAMESS